MTKPDRQEYMTVNGFSLDYRGGAWSGAWDGAWVRLPLATCGGIFSAKIWIKRIYNICTTLNRTSDIQVTWWAPVYLHWRSYISKTYIVESRKPAHHRPEVLSTLFEDKVYVQEGHWELILQFLIHIKNSTQVESIKAWCDARAEDDNSLSFRDGSAISRCCTKF